MTLFQAIIYGIVQGLTEFLPISSTAHIRIVPALLGWEKDPGAAFTAVIQIGTLIAVYLYFRQDLVRLLRGMLTGLLEGRMLQDPEARMGWMIGVGTVPIVVCGVVFKEQIKGPLRSLYVISGMLIGIALVLAAAEWLVRRWELNGMKRKELVDLRWSDALVIGLAQALALVPGTSRSGATIAGGLFQGLTRMAAARYSFLLSLPSVFAAGVYELYKERQELLSSQDDVINLLTATVVSGVVGYASIAFLLGYLRQHTLYLFIIYRLLLGGLLLALLAAGRLQPF
jgi:undecaprenyl-diphosphatase